MGVILNVSFWVGVITLVIGVLNLTTLVFGVFKVVNRQEREWQQREDRMVEAEKAITRLEADVKILTGINVQIADMKSEIERMRSRLDRFLDMQAGSRSLT